MLIKIIISFFAITIGILYGLSFIYLGRLSEYLKNKGEEKKYYKFIRQIIAWSLPILAAFMVFILPGMLISMVLGKQYVLETRGVIFDIYIFIVVPVFFITLFVLYKTGKLKNTKD